MHFILVTGRGDLNFLLRSLLHFEKSVRPGAGEKYCMNNL